VGFNPLDSMQRWSPLPCLAGVDVRAHTPATQIKRISGGFQVKTPRGAVRATHLFGGVNGYTDRLFPAVRRRAINVGSYMIATEPLTADLLRDIFRNGEMRFDTRNYPLLLAANSRLSHRLRRPNIVLAGFP